MAEPKPCPTCGGFRSDTGGVQNVVVAVPLRDLFAACALASSRAIDRPVTFMEEGPETAAAYAKAAYALADAMLERRAKP